MKKYVLFVVVLLLASAGTLLVWAPDTKAPAASTKKVVISKSVATQPSKSNTAHFDKQASSHTDPSSPWVVVNKQHPLNPIDYAPNDLINVGAGQTLRRAAATALGQMLADAKAAGITVTPASGYRSYQTQVSVYNTEVKNYGQAQADSESARPGFSEHQTGWAVDLASDGCSITDCFANTPGGAWVQANAYKYGYLLRYQQADSNTTGYRAEAWHFRYVGVKLATEMHSQNITTLEAFFEISGGTSYSQ